MRTLACDQRHRQYVSPHVIAAGPLIRPAVLGHVNGTVLVRFPQSGRFLDLPEDGHESLKGDPLAVERTSFATFRSDRGKR